MDSRKITRTIERYERLKGSVNGNPRFRFYFTDGDVHDGMSDAGWAYAVGNPEMREGSTVEVELTRAGRIRSMRPVEPTPGPFRVGQPMREGS